MLHTQQDNAETEKQEREGGRYILRETRERVDVTYSARQCRDRTAPRQLYSFITGGVEGLGYIHLQTWSWS